jgi:hypothetical protein
MTVGENLWIGTKFELIHKLFWAYFLKLLQDSLWEQLIAYMKIIWLYFIFFQINSLYINTYMVSVYAKSP